MSNLDAMPLPLRDPHNKMARKENELRDAPIMSYLRFRLVHVCPAGHAPKGAWPAYFDQGGELVGQLSIDDVTSLYGKLVPTALVCAIVVVPEKIRKF